MGKRTLVLGASTNPERYAYQAIRKLDAYQHEVVAVGLKEGTIGDIDIKTGMPQEKEIDTVTLYVGPKNQGGYYDYIIGLKPKRIIFNPGTENPELQQRAAEAGIETIEGCTLVMLSTGEY